MVLLRNGLVAARAHALIRCGDWTEDRPLASEYRGHHSRCFVDRILECLVAKRKVDEPCRRRFYSTVGSHLDRSDLCLARSNTFDLPTGRVRRRSTRAALDGDYNETIVRPTSLG
jgi:hypothetical protein